MTRYGFVPNGGRVYYTHRSQPPLLIQMVDAYITSTGDMEFLRSVLPALFMEYEFWIENRTVTYVVDDYVRYGAELDVPRPESYREDLDTARTSSKSVILIPRLPNLFNVQVSVVVNSVPPGSRKSTDIGNFLVSYYNSL